MIDDKKELHNGIHEHEINNIEVSDSKDLLTKQLEILLKELIPSIERMNTEVSYSINSFDGSTQEAIKSFHNVKESIEKVINLIKEPLDELSKINNNLHGAAKLLSILPEKIDDRLIKLPDKFNLVLNDAIPGIAQKLNSSLEKSVNTSCMQLEEVGKFIASSNEESITQLINNVKHDIGTVSKQLKVDVLQYNKEVEQIIEIGSKNRMRRLLTVFLISGSFSAIVSGVTSWTINKHFPRSVEISGNQHLVVKDSQVLVHGSDTYKLEKQKKEEK